MSRAGPSVPSFPGPCVHIPEGGRGRLFANSFAFQRLGLSPAEPPPGWGVGSIEVQRVRGSRSPWYSRTSIHTSPARDTAFCVLFEVKFHHLPLAHPFRLMLRLVSERGLPWRKPHPIFALLSFLAKHPQFSLKKKKKSFMNTSFPPSKRQEMF